jgi:hypothetical protein
MNDTDLEYRVITTADLVASGKPFEDSRTEIKREWPQDHYKAARQIAGLANAARGNHVVWIIGLDESLGVVGALDTEVSDWWGKVCASFASGFAPRLHSLIVPYESGKVLIGLSFDTSRAPFVVNTPTGKLPHREVPWREANSTRTATRADLLRILVPIQQVPEFEVISGSLTVFPFLDVSDDAQLYEYGTRVHRKRVESFLLQLKIYVTYLASDPIVIPFHRCKLNLSIEDNPFPIEQDSIKLHSDVRTSFNGPSSYQRLVDSHSIHSTSNQVQIAGSDVVNIWAQFGPETDLPDPLPQRLSVIVSFSAVGNQFKLKVGSDFVSIKGESEQSLMEYEAV